MSFITTGLNEKTKNIHRFFEKQVKTHPNEVAIRFKEKDYTYEEVNQRSNQLARYLKKQGVSKETLVAVCTPRSAEMVISILAILKSGGAYVPLDPTHPIQRNEYILKSAEVNYILTQGEVLEGYELSDILIINSDNKASDIAQESMDNLEENEHTQEIREKSQLAYVIFTSGSTGKPKGVEITHENVVNILAFMQEKLRITEDDKLLALTTITFDISVLEMFLPLTSGACVVMAAAEETIDGFKLKKVFEKEAITVMQATPATWHMLIDMEWKGSPCLKILCGGEAWNRQLADGLLDKCESLWNVYGPTETTIWSTMGQVEKGEGVITIGHPIANTTLYILDEQMREVQSGEIGELYIGGKGVGRGYLNNAELTAEKFIQNPFSTTQTDRIYKTGDLVRCLDNEKIEYIERADFQIKMRGYRIELGEIESVISSHPIVSQAVAVVVAATEKDENKKIEVFIKPRKGQYVSTGEIRDLLEAKLPSYMVPHLIQLIEEFPMTPNGKIDRKALASREIHMSEVGYAFVAPTTPIEKEVAAMWVELLEVEDIGIYDNFLELGGHSLMANRLLIRINKSFDVDLNLLEILTSELNIASIVKLIENKLFENISEEDLEGLLSEIEGLSDEETEDLLGEFIKEQRV